ncbi:unnamed protein product [Pedinophyceae sp. YPF-701]|nr:unnamed protein product [Pedinophyceae sp. YPF-701]
MAGSHPSREHSSALPVTEEEAANGAGGDGGEVDDGFSAKGALESNRMLDEVERLVSAKKVGEGRADFLREKCNALRKVVQDSIKRSADLEKQEVRLARKVEVEKGRADVGSKGGSLYILQLKEERDEAESELVFLSERTMSADIDIKQLMQERGMLQARLDEMMREAREALMPTIKGLEGEIGVVREAVAQNSSKLASARNEKRRMTGLHNDLLTEMTSVEELKARELVQLQKASAIPETARRQIELVGAAIKNYQGLDMQLRQKVQENDREYMRLADKHAQLDEEHRENGLKAQKIQTQAAKHERMLDDMRRQVELAAIENEKLLSDQVNLDMQIRATVGELKREQDQQARKQHEKELALRKLKRAEGELGGLQNQLPSLVTIRDGLVSDVAKSTAELARLRDATSELRRDVAGVKDVLVRETTLTQEAAGQLNAHAAEARQLEARIVQLKRGQDRVEHELRELASSRDRLARQVASKLYKLREARQDLGLKDMVIKDLKKQRKEVLSRVREFEQLFELVKNQRNKFVNLIQAAKQSMAEMREKLKILDNEVDILRTESNDKDSKLQKNEHDHQLAQAERDQVRNELTRSVQEFQRRQDVVDQQIAEIDKLNAIINRAERDMLRLKKQYETIVEARNYTGIMLIDRNDELCILYEKANIQQEALRRGELELKGREDEIRMLSIQRAEVQRSLEIVRRQAPRMPEYDKEIAALQHQLLQVRAKADELTAALEDPGNEGRWRLLDARVPDKEELKARRTQLEDRLTDLKQQITEKDVVLAEVSALAERLQLQAVEGRQESLDLAKKANAYQHRLRDVTRKMMAAVSELSMFQASALKLEADKESLTQLLGVAHRRLEQGLAPTEDAEREWYRRERERQVAEEMRARGEEFAKQQELEALGLVTTAEQRPNAYIPEDDPIGLPKPFPLHPPYKPTPLGATARHIRQPKPREIVI